MLRKSTVSTRIGSSRVRPSARSELANGGLAKVELRDYIRILRNRWVTIVVTTMVVLLAALLYVVVSPKTYRGQAKAFVSVNAGSKATDPAGSLESGAQFHLGQV